jgi:hypothetical protein
VDPEQEIPGLLREAQERGLRTAAEGHLLAFRVGCQNALRWHCDAGRALASEGLCTGEFDRQIELWIVRERRRLRGALRELLVSAG